MADTVVILNVAVILNMAVYLNLYNMAVFLNIQYGGNCKMALFLKLQHGDCAGSLNVKMAVFSNFMSLHLGDNMVGTAGSLNLEMAIYLNMAPTRYI
jgi:hypothetical protein